MLLGLLLLRFDDCNFDVLRVVGGDNDGIIDDEREPERSGDSRMHLSRLACDLLAGFNVIASKSVGGSGAASKSKLLSRLVVGVGLFFFIAMELSDFLSAIERNCRRVAGGGHAGAAWATEPAAQLGAAVGDGGHGASTLDHCPA